MAKRKPVLKWRKVKGEWRAGPFAAYQPPEEIRINGASWHAECGTGHDDCAWLQFCVSENDAKSCCEQLARRVIAATRKASQ